MFTWQDFKNFQDISSIYFAVQLGRCTMLSLGILGMVMLLRKTVFCKMVFVRGMLWGIFFIVPFAGKLKLYYMNFMVMEPFKRWTQICMTYTWIAHIYVLGILLMAICLFGRRYRFQRIVSGMKKELVGKTKCHITDMCVLPFTSGILIPRIVLPLVMVRNYTESELATVVLHEQVHIRLGHLWFYFLWDILRCLLWPNLLLSVCMQYFRSDIEDICDKVCVQRSRVNAQDYAALLLKTMRLLHMEQNRDVSAITYAGEKEYTDIKRRMMTILNYKPFCRTFTSGLAGAGLLLLMAALLITNFASYDNYNRMDYIVLCGSDGMEICVKDMERRDNR